MKDADKPKRSLGLTLTGLWTGSYGAIMSAFWGLSLLGAYAPADFAMEPITSDDLTKMVVNLVAGLCGVVIGFALVRRRRWGYWLGLILHVFTIGNVVINEVEFAALTSVPLKTVLVIGGGVVSVISLLILMYLMAGRTRAQFATQ